MLEVRFIRFIRIKAMLTFVSVSVSRVTASASIDNFLLASTCTINCIRMQEPYSELRDPPKPSKPLQRYGVIDWGPAEAWARRHPFDIVNRLLEEQARAERAMSEKAAAERRAAELAAKLEDATAAMAAIRVTAAAQQSEFERRATEMERMVALSAAAESRAAEMAAQLEERVAEIATLRGAAAENATAENRAAEEAAQRDGVTAEMAAATTRFYAAADQAAPEPRVAEARIIMNLAEVLAALSDRVAADRTAAEQRAADTATRLNDLADELTANRRRMHRDGRASRHRSSQNKRARGRASPKHMAATESATAHSSLDAATASSSRPRKSAAGGAGARARRAARRRLARVQEGEAAT